MSETLENGEITLSKSTINALKKHGCCVDSQIDSSQLEELLTSDDEDVRIAIAKCLDFKANKNQIERGVTDTSEEVREAFAKRIDYKPTKRQLERGLTDKFQKVRSAFYRRGDVVLSDMQKERARKGGFNVFSSTSLEEHDEPDTICPFCKTWILAEEDTWCKHLAYIHLPPFFYGGIEKGPSAKTKYEQWLKKNSVNPYDCSARKFDLFCKNFGFKRRFVSGSETAGFECGKIIYAFVDEYISF